MLKKGDVIIIDDEVRASASQKRETGTLCTEEFFLRTQYIHLISAERFGGAVNRRSTQHIWTVPAGFQLPAGPHTAERGLQNTYDITLWLGKTNKANVFLYADTPHYGKNSGFFRCSRPKFTCNRYSEKDNCCGELPTPLLTVNQLGCTSPLPTVNPVGGVLHHPCTVPVYKLLFIRQ